MTDPAAASTAQPDSAQRDPAHPAQHPAQTPVRRNAAIEAVVVCGLALFTVFVLIPAQTTPGDAAAGLAPATLPTACALAIAALALINLVVLMARGRSQFSSSPPFRPSRPATWPVLAMMLVSLAGVIALAYGGPKACAVVIVPLGMLALGERRIRWILPITLLALAPFVLLF